MVSPTSSVELGGMYVDFELLVELSTCTKLCEETKVTTGLEDGLGDGVDVDEDGTGEGETEDVRKVLTDVKAGVLLAWDCDSPDPEVPRGFPPGSWK